VIEVTVEPCELEAGRECGLRIQFHNTGPGTCTDIVFRLGLPTGWLLLRGRNRVDIPELGAGGTLVHQLTVRPRADGSFTVASENFSYRNEYGTLIQPPEFQAGLTVLPDRPAPGPDLAIDVLSGPLALAEWGVLRLGVRNVSPSTLRGLGLFIGGPIQLAPSGSQAVLPDLAAGQHAEASFIVCPRATGSHVPAQARVTYDSGSGRIRVLDQPIPLVVRAQPPDDHLRPAERSREPDRILFLAASPKDMPPLRSDEEMREIGEMLQLGRYRDRFRLESAQAARLKDAGRALLDHHPKVVHFSGHGRTDGSLYLEDGSGFSKPAAAEGLAELFRVHEDSIECAVVNACDTLLLAQAISQHIRYVIAMRSKIGDPIAINFSTGFYQGLAAGEPVPTAFAQGRAFALTQAPSEDVAVLLGRGGQILR
jgi:CHAT domain